MAENYREYKPQRDTPRRKTAKSSGYFKKFLRQTLCSILIFSFIFMTGIFNQDLSTKIKSFAKNALTYTIDKESVSKVFDTIINALENKGELQNEEQTQTEQNL